MIANLITAPEKTKPNLDYDSIFLAGTIEMGQSEDWQAKVVDRLKNKRVNIFNPRRTQWDSTWEQDIDNPNFYEQVTWELDRLDKSDLILFYFDPTSKSPITLMELGLSVGFMNKSIVVCPPGYWRRGNVEIICQRYKIPFFNNIDAALVAVQNFIEL